MSHANTAKVPITLEDFNRLLDLEPNRLRGLLEEGGTDREARGPWSDHLDRRSLPPTRRSPSINRRF